MDRLRTVEKERQEVSIEVMSSFSLLAVLFANSKWFQHVAQLKLAFISGDTRKLTNKGSHKVIRTYKKLNSRHQIFDGLLKSGSTCINS